MKWLLEQSTFGYDDFDADHQMVAALKESGTSYTLHAKTTLASKIQAGPNPGGTPFIYRGSINFCRAVECSKVPIKPTTDWESFGFLNWMTRYGEFALNNNYFALPYGDLKRRWRDIEYYFGHPPELFIRPNSGVKTFPGHVFKLEDYQRLANPLDIHRDTIVILANTDTILREYRVLIVNKKVVSGSQYMKGGDLSIESHATVPPTVWYYAESVAEAIDGNDLPICVIDIAETYTGLSLLEINRFESSELYGMDYSRVVSAVNDFYESW